MSGCCSASNNFYDVPPEPSGCGCASSDGNQPGPGSALNLFQEAADKLTGPLEVMWTVSRECNFACPHCFNNSGPKKQLTHIPVEEIVAHILEVQPYNVCLCGGEPFAWDCLDRILVDLSRGGIPLISCVTNGYLVTPERLKEVIDNGLTNLQFSIDGHCAEVHQGTRSARQGFDRVMAALSAALELQEAERLNTVAVSFTPTRHNFHHYEATARKLIGLGVRMIRCQPFMPCGRGIKAAAALVPSAGDYASLMLDIRNLRAEYGRQGVTLEWGCPLEHLWMFSQTPVRPQSVFINSYGWYELSPYLPLFLGDTRVHSIKSFWQLGQEEAWKLPLVVKMARTLLTLDGMSKIQPVPYYDPPVLIDLFDDENRALAEQTDDEKVLIEYARNKRLYRSLEVA